MHQVVWLVETEGKKAIVEMRRHSACGKCGACWTGTEAKRFTVRNPQGIGSGNRVIIELPEDGVLWAAFIVYLIPVIVGVAVAFLARTVIVSLTDGWFCIIFLFSILSSFMVLRKLDKQGYFKDHYLPVVTGLAEDE